MSSRFNTLSRNLAVAVVLLSCAFQSRAASITFQQRAYDVTVVPLAGVPASGGCDLIFVFIPSTGQKFLAIPNDPTARASYDPDLQRFYRVDRQAGFINAFVNLNATFINLDGTFNTTKIEAPAQAGSNYQIPVEINQTVNADIALVDPDTLIYRTNETMIYEVRRDPNPFVLGTPRSIPIKTLAPVAVEHDGSLDTVLLVQTLATDNNNAPLSDRISSYFRSGQFFDEIVLVNNPAIPGYKGNASGIAADPDTGDIYVLDTNQLIVFKIQTPKINAIAPKVGPPAGGTPVTITGQFFPADAQVFFDGIPAGNLTVVSTTQITCTTPAHALGPVDLTMTGAGITFGVPLVLAKAFTYVNTPPVAVLSASPTQGNTPLAVSFNVSSSTDPDGTLIQRVIDFGDGSSYTFPTDLSVVTVSHTYNSNSTFTATLTVTDNMGATHRATQIIIVGTGGENLFGTLVLRKLSLKIAVPSTNSDKLQLTGEVVLPAGIDQAQLDGGSLTITLNNFTSQTITLDAKGQFKQLEEAFSMKPLKRKGFDPNTFTIAYTRTHSNFAEVVPADAVGRVQMIIAVNISTPLGRTLTYQKAGANQAVVNVKKSAKRSSLTLVRK